MELKLIRVNLYLLINSIIFKDNSKLFILFTLTYINILIDLINSFISKFIFTRKTVNNYRNLFYNIKSSKNIDFLLQEDLYFLNKLNKFNNNYTLEDLEICTSYNF